MVVLFTDFGAADIYVGQLKAALLERLPASTIIVDLLHSVPNYHVRAGAHLLAALQSRFPAGAVFVAVIDPGVGTSRNAVVIEADDKWYVGPDNGLLSVVGARAAKTRAWRIVWRPPALSASFHGRDLFAPVAASLAASGLPEDKLQEMEALDVRLESGDLAEVIYVDHYGNALTGLRASALALTSSLAVSGHRIPYARVFADAPKGSTFWYENSIGLVELAASQASAASTLGIEVGDPVRIVA
jgi:S-adenosylmethionine hydrolase